MAKTKPKHRPGIHLFKENDNPYGKALGLKPEWHWQLVSSNGQVMAISRKSYTRKENAVKSIRIVANVFYMQFQDNGTPAYYDHSQPNTPLKSYL